MLKRLCILVLTLVLIGSVAFVCYNHGGNSLSGQNNTFIQPSTTITKAPTKTNQPIVQPDKEQNILIIGNSHSVDAFWLLYQAYMDQYPDTELCIGILHYGGACIDEHVDFANNKDEVIRYYKKNSDAWEIQYNVTTEYVLTDRPWNIVLMQPAKEDLADETLNKDGRYALAEIIDTYVTVPHKIMWHISWPSPNDETFFSPDYVRQPPEGYKDKLTRLYGFDPVNQFDNMLQKTKDNVLNDTLYDQSVCSGSAIMHAMSVQGFSQLELWRDYTHLSDYGRLMVGYALVAQFTGNPIQEVNIDRIPIGWRHKQNKSQGVQQLTEAMKNGIINAANYSLENPWQMPEK